MSAMTAFEIAILDLLTEIRNELRAVHAKHERRQDTDDRANAELVRQILLLAEKSGDDLGFNVAELLEHAQVSPEMQTAIVQAVGALNGKKLGKWLRRIEGHYFDNTRIVRNGTTREGISWTCERAALRFCDRTKAAKPLQRN